MFPVNQLNINNEQLHMNQGHERYDRVRFYARRELRRPARQVVLDNEVESNRTGVFPAINGGRPEANIVNLPDRQARIRRPIDFPVNYSVPVANNNLNFIPQVPMDARMTQLSPQTAPKPAEKKLKIPESPIHDRVMGFLNNETFTDVTLKVDGVELKAHKIFLAAQSPVFSVMFENTMMREARENYVIIEDIDVDVARQMLEFIYSNKRPSRLDEFSLELMAVAQKYQMERLKAMCEESAINNLSNLNAVNILVYAYLYEAKELKKTVVNFMRSHRFLLKTQEFRKLEGSNPKLVIEILKDLCGVASNNNPDKIIEIFD